MDRLGYEVESLVAKKKQPEQIALYPIHKVNYARAQCLTNGFPWMDNKRQKVKWIKVLRFRRVGTKQMLD